MIQRTQRRAARVSLADGSNCDVGPSTANNPEHRSETLDRLKAEYEKMAASMNTPEAREAAKCAFDSGADVFRARPLKRTS